MHEASKMNNHNLLLWNVQRLQSTKDKVLKLVSNHSSLLLAILETMMNEYNKFRIPNYHIFNKTRHFNWLGVVGCLFYSFIWLLILLFFIFAATGAAARSCSGTVNVAD